MDEFSAPLALDSSGRGRDAAYEPGVVFFLEGPSSDAFCTGGETNRAAHFAGGRMRARLAGLGTRYSVSLWLWNGMPASGRGTAGWFFSRGRDHGLGPNGEHVGVGGTATLPGRLIHLRGSGKPAVGRTVLKRWTWNHVVFVRDGEAVRVHLNGDPKPEIELASPAGSLESMDRFFFGGRSDSQANWEGRLDEISVFDRSLSPQEIGAIGVRK